METFTDSARCRGGGASPTGVSVLTARAGVDSAYLGQADIWRCSRVPVKARPVWVPGTHTPGALARLEELGSHAVRLMLRAINGGLDSVGAAQNRSLAAFGRWADETTLSSLAAVRFRSMEER